MSKKGKKNKWKTVELTTVLAETRPVTAWADEVEIDERDLQLVAARKSALPTAPRSARGTDDERVPNAPPYVAYITNIPFELVEEEIAELFGDLQIENIRLPRNDATGRLKGYGYVEFTERQGLIEALQISDKSLKGRRIRIDVSENSDRDRGYGRSDRMGRDRMGMGMGRDRDDDPDRASGDWRSAPRVEPAGEDRMRSSGRSGYGSGGFGRDGERSDRDGGFGAPRESDNREGGWREGMGSGTGGSDRFSDRDRDRDSFRSRGFGDRDRDGFDRDRGSRYGGDRERDGFGDRPRYGDRDGDRYGDRPRFGDREREREDDRERYPRRDDGPRRDDVPRRDDGPPADSGEPRGRPKLNLQPRTRPIENPLPPPEEVKEKEKEAPAPAPAPPVPRASIFGAAKPVDTTAREREIEERLARERDRAPRREDRDKSSEAPRSKESSEHGDESQSKKVEPAPPPKENAWSRRPRIEPTANNGDSSRDEGERRATSPDSNEGNTGRPYSEGRGRQDSKQDENTGRSRSYGNSKDRGEGKRGQSSDGREHRNDRSDSRDKRDDREQDSWDESSSTDRPSRKDHSNDDQPRLPKYEEKTIPNFVASNKYAFLNEDDHDD